MPPSYTAVNAVTDWGAVGDGSTDNYARLQPRFDALQPNTHVHFPAGYYRTSRTLSHGADDVWISGDGRATHLSIYDNAYYMPTLTVGVRTVERNNQAMTSSIRPDMYGVMDSTWAANPGQRYGFRTMGQTVAKAVAGPATIGALSQDSITNGGRLFDYWGEATGVTVRVALFMTPTSAAQMRANGNGAVILGLGDQINPGPWCLGVDSSNPMNIFFGFKTADQGLDVNNVTARSFRFTLPASGIPVTGGQIFHLEVWVDFVTGAYGARVNNTAVTTTNPSGVTGLAGKKFAKNRGYQFVIGPSQNALQFNFSWGTVPDFGVYAFNVLRTASLAAANTDSSRYAAVTNTVVSTDVNTSTPLDRTMLLKCGQCVPFDGTAARIFHTGPDLGFVVSAVVSDMKITGGLGIGAVNHIKISRVQADNGIVGLEHYNLGTAYTVDVSDCRFGGYDSAVDLGQVIATFRGTNIQGMGDVAIRARACSITADGMFVAGFSNGGRAVFDFIDGETNGIYTFRGVQIDTEGYTFNDPDGDGGAVFKIDLHSSSPSTVLNVSGLQQDSSGANAAVFLLRGRKGTSTGGVLIVDGCQVGLNNGALIKVAGADWKGSIDRRGLRVQNVLGTSANVANIKFTGEAASGGVIRVEQ